MKKLKRIIAVSLFAVMALSACGQTAPAPVEVAPPAEAPAEAEVVEDPMFTPGTYEGVGAGINGEIKVEVDVDANKILEVRIVEHMESPGISDMVWERMPGEIVEFQTVGVDTVSGATVSSDGLIEAVTAALVAAGGDMAVLSVPVEKAASTEVIEKVADVVVVGAGGAGLSAAVAAHQNGASVIVIEKMPKVGGNTIISGAAYNTSDVGLQGVLDPASGPSATIENLINAESENDLHAQLQQKLKNEYDTYKSGGSHGLFDSPTMHALQTYEGGDRVGNLEIIENFTNNTYPTLQWLQSVGMGFTDEIFTVLGALWPRSHRPVMPLGTGYIDALSKYVDANGIEIMYDTTADAIIAEGNRVVGVRAAAGDGATVNLTANKGVVLATGGFAKNIEMRMKYDKVWGTLDETIKSTNHPGATGDGIIMAEEIGAALVGMEYIQLLPMGDPETGSLSGNIEKSVEDRIFVNKSGERFVAEDARRDVMTEALFAQEDAYMWVIVDVDDYPTGDAKNNFNETIDDLVAAGRAFKGDTLEELAAEINVDPAVFVETVENYNKAVDAKTDEFGRTLFGSKIDKAPFYAGARVPTVHHTMGGVKVNVLGQVLDTNDNVMEGFYAAGEVTGGLHGSNRLGGNALADVHTHGRLVGTYIATH